MPDDITHRTNGSIVWPVWSCMLEMMILIWRDEVAPKEKAKKELTDYLNKHKREIDWEIGKNKARILRLTEEQTILKRKKVEVDKAINALSD